MSKDQGGLGIRRSRDTNEIMLLKWWWRYEVEDKSLWKKVIISMGLKGADGYH